MGKRPSPGRLRQFLTKYIFSPIGRVFNKIPVEEVLGLTGAAAIMWIMWATFKDRLEQIGAPPLDAFLRYGDWRQKRVLGRMEKKKLKLWV